MTLVLIDNERTQVVQRVPQGEARREATLRDLIVDHPDLLPVHDIDPSYGRLITVTKELSIPGVGFVDVLLMDEDGRLVVVECKLWRNPQARREVVGQILDYARELSRYGFEDLQRQVSIATKRQGNVLYALAQSAGGTLGEAEFVDRIARDLAAGRFLLLVVGDGIAEGTRRIGEYLRDQPGLAFGFGLVEMAEYRIVDDGGVEHVIMQPSVLAQTTMVERHVIRSEIPGVVIDAAGSTHLLRSDAGSSVREPTEAGASWRQFVERFIAEARFDDPGQPPPRNGGNGWIRVPLPAGLYVNAYRTTSGGGQVGTQVRFSGADATANYEFLAADRGAIEAEFEAAGLPAPDWIEGDVPVLSLTSLAPRPWNDAEELEQRRWMAAAANQFVNSLRPRLRTLEREMAA